MNIPHDEAASADPLTMKLSVAQFLALAKAANVQIEAVDGRLILRSTRMDRKLWPTIRRCLDEIGIEAIRRYFETTASEDREILSAAAPMRPADAV